MSDDAILIAQIKEEHAAQRQRIAELEQQIAQLKGIEADLRVILNSVYDAIFVHALDGRVLDVNDKMLDMYRVDREQALTFSILDDYSSPDNPLDELPERWHRVIAGEELCFEWKARRPLDNTIFDVEVSLRRMTLQQQVCIIATIRDISTRKQAEERLKTFFTLVEHAPDGIGVASLDGTITYANPAYRTMMGYNGSLLGMNLQQLYAESPLNEWSLSFQQTLNRVLQHGSWCAAMTYCRKDGTTFVGQFSAMTIPNRDGQPAAVAGIVRDMTPQNTMEAALLKSQSLLQSVIDHAPSAISVRDTEGRYILVNQTVARGLNRPPEEIIGKTQAELFDSEIAMTVQRYDQQVIETGKPISFERLMPSGDRVYAQLVTKFPIYDSHGRLYAVGGIGTDITNSKQAEQQLLLLSTALQAAANGVVITDNRGNIIWVNHAFTQLTGYTDKEAIGRHSNLLKSNIHDAAFYKTLWQTITSGRVWHGEITNRHKHGHLYIEDMTITPVHNDSGHISHFVAIKQDITARKRSERALQQSEERYALAVRGANDGLWDWDVRTNRIYFSPRWKAILGYAEHEISTRPAEWFRRVHPDDYAELDYRITNHLYGDTPHFKHEYRIRHRDGSYRWMLCRGIAVHGDDGQPTRLAGSQSDITARKDYEALLQYHAWHDGLTGLPNRTYFDHVLQQAIAQIQQEATYRFAVILLDIDRFSLINDSLGHLVGDQLLQQIVNRMQHCLGSQDTLARFGGDEFTILLDRIVDVSDATRAADAIQRALGKGFAIEEHHIVVSASIGIALSNANYRNPSELLRDADIAMYRAKELGRAGMPSLTPPCTSGPCADCRL
ncbi:MAG: PAS domain S-box protein [Chloroflexaceae bacterium]|nr:PAS domain S-box protein [Chloroflexaceae bacterium]